MDSVVALGALLARAVVLVAAACLAALGAVVVYGVVLRYGFNAEPSFVEQVALLLVISVAMFGAAAGVHESGHIGLDSVARLLPPRGRFWFSAASEALVFVFAVVLLWGSLTMAESTHLDTIPTLGISEAWRYAAPIVASVLIAYFAVEHLLVQFLRPDLEQAWN